MKTKQEERTALAQIAAIIEDCGPDSYIGMTFQHTIDMAEDNIKNDFGNSWYGIAQNEAKNNNELAEKLTAAEAQLDELNAENERLKAQILSHDDIGIILKAVRNWQDNAEQREKESAAEIVRTAENPADPDFKAAVARNRIAAKSIAEAGRIWDRLSEIF